MVLHRIDLDPDIEKVRIRRDIPKDIRIPYDLKLYDFKSLSHLMIGYASDYRDNTGVDIFKSFLIKNLRKPNEYEMNYLNRIHNNTIDIPWLFLMIVNNTLYSAQNLFMKLDHKYPITEEIRIEYRGLVKYEPAVKHIYFICNHIRHGIHSINIIKDYCAINTWQLMNVVSVLYESKINLTRDNITIVFNKIYNRNPIDKEISICLELNPSQDKEEVRNAFFRHTTISDEDYYRRRRW